MSKDLSHQKNKLLLVFAVFLTSCTSMEPDFDSIYRNHFSLDQLNEVSEAFNNSLGLFVKYSFGEIVTLELGEWEILQPIMLNSEYNKAMVAVGVKRFGVRSNTVNIEVFTGFRNSEDWHFFSTTYYPILMEEPDGERTRQFTFEEINIIAYEEYFSKCVKYNAFSGEWSINDEYINSLIGGLKTADNLKIRNRRIQVINLIWDEQDSLRSEGKIDDAKWKEVVRLRAPKTSEDWRAVKAFHKEVDKDSVIRNLFAVKSKRHK